MASSANAERSTWASDHGKDAPSEDEEAPENQAQKPGTLRKIWTAFGLDLGTVLIMAKYALEGSPRGLAN